VAERRKPSQARSRASVDALIEATGLVLAKRGYEKTTTKRIADRAGLSIGSLYQYFPDKQALMQRFFESRIRDDADRLRKSGESAPLSEAIPAIALEILRLFREDRELYASLALILPLVDQTDEVRAGMAKALADMTHLLARHPDQLAPGLDPELAAITIVHGLRGLCYAIAAHAPEKLNAPALDQLVVDLARSCLRGRVEGGDLGSTSRDA
jgi:AcrR family transcriptional regulator